MHRSALTARRSRHRLPALAAGLALIAASLMLTVARAAPAHAANPYPLGPGYWLIAADGGVFSFGDAQFYGSTGNIKLAQPIVGAVADPFLEGYWMVASDGGVFNFGSATFFGSAGNLKLAKPVVGMAATPSSNGYWLVASDGGIFNYGDAQFFGSTGGMKLNKPIVGMARTPSGQGYWLVASDGGIFTFGDAQFFGSTGNTPLTKPIVGIARTPTGQGYWLVASDGGIFAFGDAKFLGSTGNITLNQPIVNMAATPKGDGYDLIAKDGGVFSFGNTGFLGSTGNMKLNQPIIGGVLRPPLALKIDAFADQTGTSSAWVDTGGGKFQLQLSKTAGDASVLAGARVLGVRGLTVGQLGKIGFTVASGTCNGTDPAFALVYGAGSKPAGSLNMPCVGGGTQSFDPVALGAPADAPITSLDIVIRTAGASSALTNFTFSGFGMTVTDFRTFRQDGSTIS